MSGNELAPPLSLWEKIKTGVTDIVKNAVNILPKGVILLGAIMATSAITGMVVPHGDFLNVTNRLAGGHIGSLLTTSATYLLMGTLIYGSAKKYMAHKLISSVTAHGIMQGAAYNEALQSGYFHGMTPDLPLAAPKDLPLNVRGKLGPGL